MSNLSSLMQSGSVDVAEAMEYESMTESDMSQIMQVAIEDIAIESVIEELSENQSASLLEGVLPEDLVVMEKTIVRMDKNAKRQRAYKLAILQCAKEDDNKDYKKLETIWKMEKYLMRRLERKYAARARSRMHQTSKKASKKTTLGSKLKKHLSNGPKLTRSQKETKKALAGDTKPPSQVKSQFNSISSKLSGKIK
jgi:hypothetical protein